MVNPLAQQIGVLVDPLLVDHLEDDLAVFPLFGFCGEDAQVLPSPAVGVDRAEPRLLGEEAMRLRQTESVDRCDFAQQGEPVLMPVQLKPGVVIRLRLAHQGEKCGAVLVMDCLVGFQSQGALDHAQRIAVALRGGLGHGAPRQQADKEPANRPAVGEALAKAIGVVQNGTLVAGPAEAVVGQQQQHLFGSRPGRGGGQARLKLFWGGVNQLQHEGDEAARLGVRGQRPGVGEELPGEFHSLVGAAHDELDEQVGPGRSVSGAARQSGQQFASGLARRPERRFGLEERRQAEPRLGV